MKFFRIESPRIISSGILVILACIGEAADGTAQHATIANAVKEGDLATVKISPEAGQRLGIVTASIERRPVSREMMFPGEMVLLLATKDGPVSAQPILGASSEEMRRVSDLQADAEGKLKEAQTTFDAAETAMKRAEQMMADKAGSQRAVDEARAASDLAGAVLMTAQARRGLLGIPVAEAAQGITQWVRATVSAAELGKLDARAPARVAPLADSRGKGVEARRVNAPSSANPAAGTVDVFYELAKVTADLQVGQRVAIRIPVLGAGADSLVVPHSAIVHDFTGGAWVYEETAPQTFVRRRVLVDRVAGADAILARGPGPGTKVVTSGAAELFGTEFGSGK